VADELAVASRIGTGLARLFRLIERSASVRGDDLDRPSFMLLHTLVCVGASRVTAVAAAVHSDPSTVSRPGHAAMRAWRPSSNRGSAPNVTSSPS